MRAAILALSFALSPNAALAQQNATLPPSLEDQAGLATLKAMTAARKGNPSADADPISWRTPCHICYMSASGPACVVPIVCPEHPLRYQGK